MDDLESRLRTSFSHQVGDTPALPDLAETVVRRGRHVRRRRTGLLVASVVLVAASGLALSQQGAQTALPPAPVAHGPSATPVPTPTGPPPVAPASWVAGLSRTRGALSTTVLLGDRVLFPGAADIRAGVTQVVHAATPVADGVLLSTSPEEGTLNDTSRLLVLSPPESIRTLDDQVTYGHAVDPTGTLVAYGSQRDGKEYVRSIATGAVVHSIQRHDRSGAGRPFGWVGDEVLMTTGDGGAVDAKAWNVVTGKVRTIGRPADGYYGGYGNAVGSDLVALDQGDGTCFAVSHLGQTGNLWSTCNGLYGGFSPDGSALLLTQEQSGLPAVPDAVTGHAGAPLALPATGVVAAGWSDDTHVAAVVRVPGKAVRVVTCPVSGAACSPVVEAPDVSGAWVVNARR